jgi:hypothetical protein
MDYYPHTLPLDERNPTPITVDDEYEIPNGVLEVRRNLFNDLPTHPWVDDRDIQQRYGISRGDLQWKDYFLFKQKRMQKPKPKPNN